MFSCLLIPITLLKEGVQVWEEEDAEDDLNPTSQVLHNSSALVLWICQFLVLMQRNLSDAAIGLLFIFLRHLFQNYCIHKLQKLISGGDMFKCGL